ncbi:MAG: hypothetical protein K8F25_19570 [Fimbriimonadaceae bacterium]|nr:hypothetical protein [Alphaproteobacteria bacterium]
MLDNVIGDLPLAANLLLFALAAAAVWFSGARLAALADEISDRLRIGRALMGLLFLATATSLPEIVTTIVAASLDNAALVLNNLLGGITLQTAILAIADVFAIGVAITAFPRKPTAVLQGALVALLLAVMLGIVSIGEMTLVAQIGLGSSLLALCYVAAIALLRFYDSDSVWVPVEVPEASDDDEDANWISHFPDLSTAVLQIYFFGLTLIILVAGIVSVVLAERIAVQSGTGSSFIGVTLLATSTSLPELSTTIAAVRLHSYTLAISNVFGSNLIMIVMIWPADLFYRRDSIINEVDAVSQLALISGLLVTLIYVIGLLVRSRKKFFGVGRDSAIVLVIYVATLIGYVMLIE